MDNNLSIGIDLGTSNCALALSRENLEIVEITQLTGAGAVGESSLLPSSIYLSASGEFADQALNPPWAVNQNRDYAVGIFAREHGAVVPDRLISSAKSWLCNSHVDRKSAFLPWRSESVSSKLSPVEASARLLRHLRDNLLFHRPGGESSADLDAAQTVLTVPASFDEAARTLTAEAAQQAGWSSVVLLEEPQAAFYSWISRAEDQWRKQICPGDLILVCDIGGGTTDFSLIAVSQENGELCLDRICVGDHILLGGDNMDLALAFAARGALEQQGVSLTQWQMLALVQLARSAKERLFADPELNEVPLSIPGRGSSLLRNTVSAVITREQAISVVLNGFFPQTAPTDLPEERKTAGLQEFGLPYASDPAVTKHLARFLQRSLTNVLSDPSLRGRIAPQPNVEQAAFLRPTAILFNGGVLKAAAIRERIMSILREWIGSGNITELAGGDLDQACARGAAYYGALRRSGKGLRIKAGTARSYYLGIEASMPAVPGYRPPVRGLCVVPQGTEEGTTLVLPEQEFGLATGQPAEFRFFCSTTRAGDHLGTVIEDAEHELEETARLEVLLPAVADQAASVVPVRLQAVVTEVGTLELWMKHLSSDSRWKLDFNVRAKD